MPTRQTRIFVPPRAPFDRDTWVENIIGHIISPLAQSKELNWFWFSRYGGYRSDSGDCDIIKIPEAFAFPPSNIYKSLRFRFSISDEAQDSFEEKLSQGIEKMGCGISDFREYDSISDMAGNRFLGEPRTEEKRKERVALVAAHFCATSKLFINCVQGPDQDGYFSMEKDPDSGQNPHGNIFESVHHIFCNQTNVPLRVILSQTSIGTDWYPPKQPDQYAPIRF